MNLEIGNSRVAEYLNSQVQREQTAWCSTHQSLIYFTQNAMLVRDSQFSSHVTGCVCISSHLYGTVHFLRYC